MLTSYCLEKMLSVNKPKRVLHLIIIHQASETTSSTGQPLELLRHTVHILIILQGPSSSSSIQKQALHGGLARVQDVVISW